MENLKVLAYELDGWKDTIEVRLERVKQIDGPDLWAIREKGCCLNQQGEWELEPMPSNRKRAFLERCRWNSAETAVKFWRTGHQSRFEHYRIDHYRTRETRNAESASGFDPLYQEAQAVARELGFASVSQIQRKLRVGYTRAARFVEMMAENGFCEKEPDLAGRRKLLADPSAQASPEPAESAVCPDCGEASASSATCTNCGAVDVPLP